MTVTHLKPRLRAVEETPERYGDYRDWLKANRKSREWKIEPTEKHFGDLEVTSRGVERLG